MNPLRSVACSFALLALSTLAVACTGDEDEAATTTTATTAKVTFNSCSVLESADVEKALGAPVVGREPNASSPAVCFYLTTKPGNQANVSIQYEQGAGYYGLAGEGDPVAGVGDAAKWVKGKILVAHDGSHYVDVTIVSSADEGTRQRQAVGLAKAALRRMR